MPTLKDMPPIEEIPFQEVHPDVVTQQDNGNLPRHRWKKLLIVSLLLGSILIVIASLQKPTKTDEEQLEVLQLRLKNGKN